MQSYQKWISSAMLFWSKYLSLVASNQCSEAEPTLFCLLNQGQFYHKFPPSSYNEAKNMSEMKKLVVMMLAWNQFGKINYQI